jgi:hypothetical protein
VISPLVLYGRLVTFDDGKVIDNGALYIGEDEKIAAVQDADAPPPAGFEQAKKSTPAGRSTPA